MWYLFTIFNSLHQSVSIFQQRLHQFHLSRLSADSGLVSYILPSCRRGFASGYDIGNIGPDWCLFLQDDLVRQHAVAWRCNILFLHRHCICGEFFNRQHVSKCCLLINVSFISSQQLAMLTSDIHSFPALSNTTYCILDSLLNHRQYDSFEDAIEFLMTILISWSLLFYLSLDIVHSSFQYLCFLISCLYYYYYFCFYFVSVCFFLISYLLNFFSLLYFYISWLILLFLFVYSFYQ